MDLNSLAASHRKSIAITFDLLRSNKAPSQELNHLADPILLQLAKNFYDKKFEQNIGPHETNGPAVLQHLEAYIRAESHCSLYRAGKVSQAEFAAFIKSDNLPFYLKPYFQGVMAYLTGDKIGAYELFTKAGIYNEELVLTYARFIDSSIRGTVSTVPLADMGRLLESYDPTTIDEKFPVTIISQPSKKPAHIVGTDPVYWERYEDLFVNWATPILEDADIWVVCVNFSDEVFEQVKAKHPAFKFARMSADYKNIIPFYTMVRFIMAEKLSRIGVETVICSDIDVYFEANGYGPFIQKAPEGVSCVHNSNGHVPWRSVAAMVTIWRGDKGRTALQFFVNFLAEKFRFDGPSGNRQWWVDQVPLAMLADATTLGYDKCPEALRCFNPLTRASVPVRSPLDVRMTKAEFAAAYGSKSA